MSIISEAYFTHVDTKWDYVGQFGAPRLMRAYRSSELTQSCLPLYYHTLCAHRASPRQGPPPVRSRLRPVRVWVEAPANLQGARHHHARLDQGERGLRERTEGQGRQVGGDEQLALCAKVRLGAHRNGTFCFDPPVISLLAGQSRFPLSETDRYDSLPRFHRLPTSSSWALRLSKATKEAMAGPWTCGKR